MNHEKKRNRIPLSAPPAAPSSDYAEILSRIQEESEEPVIHESLIKCMEAELEDSEAGPPVQYGQIRSFLCGFLTADMRKIFREIAEAFFQEEPFLRDPEKRNLFRNMYEPIREGETPEDTFFYPALEMMLICALNGSAYSRTLLLELYKTYYRKEYNVLKRFRSLTIFDMDEFFKIEAERLGISDYTDDMDDTDCVPSFKLGVMGRMEIMGRLMHIEPDGGWKLLMKRLNRLTIEHDTLCKSLELLYLDPEYLKSAKEQFEENAAALNAAMPDFAFTFNDDCQIPGGNEPLRMLSLSRRIIRNVLTASGLDVDLFLNNSSFNLHDSTVRALNDVSNSISAADQAERVVLFGVIRYLSEIVSTLEKTRRADLQTALGFRYEEILDNDALRRCDLDIAYLDRIPKNRSQQSDPQCVKILEKARRSLRTKASNNAAGSGSRSNDRPSGTYGSCISGNFSCKKIMIVGGHENWIKKLRRIFPGWIYISGKSGLRMTGAIESCDKIFFYTDICGHSLYYRFISLAAEYQKPYSYLHGTNMDQVIESIYENMKHD